MIILLLFLHCTGKTIMMYGFMARHRLAAELLECVLTFLSIYSIGFLSSVIVLELLETLSFISSSMDSSFFKSHASR